MASEQSRRGLAFIFVSYIAFVLYLLTRDYFAGASSLHLAAQSVTIIGAAIQAGSILSSPTYRTDRMTIVGKVLFIAGMGLYVIAHRIDG